MIKNNNFDAPFILFCLLNLILFLLSFFKIITFTIDRLVPIAITCLSVLIGISTTSLAVFMFSKASIALQKIKIGHKSGLEIFSNRYKKNIKHILLLISLYLIIYLLTPLPVVFDHLHPFILRIITSLVKGFLLSSFFYILYQTYMLWSDFIDICLKNHKDP